MEYTPEQTQDFELRAVGFNKEYEDLKTKWKCEHILGVQTVGSISGIFGLAPTTSIGDIKFKPTARNEGDSEKTPESIIVD